MSYYVSYLAMGFIIKYQYSIGGGGENDQLA
jgi:hypothetical protein